MRALAEGRIKWAFWPLDTNEETIRSLGDGDVGAGIWITSDDQGGLNTVHDTDSDGSFDGGEETDTEKSSEGESSEAETYTIEEESEDGKHETIGNRTGMFAALSVTDTTDDQDESDVTHE